MKILSTIACNLDSQVLLSALPLLEAERVEAIEWSFDTLYQFAEIPEWFNELLLTFGNEKRLIAHGVYFSLFTARWSEEQKAWLNQLRQVSQTFSFDHVTEHFGFMTGADFHKGAPISIPFTATTLSIGKDRLQRIADAAQCPVGLENLAFAYSLEAVRRQGDFLEQLVGSVNGFIILDLHNLYCQLCNFSVDFDQLLDSYPLHRVREIHISGGSWEDSAIAPDKKIRRDTHDDAVPQEVFQLLEAVMGKCPNLKYVVLEQLGTGLATEESQEQFRQDFFKMDELVQAYNRQMDLAQNHFDSTSPNSFLANYPIHLAPPLDAPELYTQQMELSAILEKAEDYTHAKALLTASSLAHSEWKIEDWEAAMLETSLRIAQKWKNGFV